MGEVNKGAIGLIVVLLVGAAGYLWYMQMYKPAVTARTAAVAAQTAADAERQKAKSDLEAAKQQAQAEKDKAAKPDPSVPTVQIASKAVPQKKMIDDAAIVLMDLADQAGISTTFSSESGADVVTADASGGGGLQGAQPIDITFQAGGTYQEMMLFMSLVENTVTSRHGKLYVKDRLFNVVGLKLGVSEDGDSGFGSDTGSDTDDGPILGPNDMLFTVTVRMYTSSTENAESVGQTTPDDAAQAPAAGGDASAGAAGTAGGTSATDGAGAASGAGTANGSGSGAAGATSDVGAPAGQAGAAAPAGAATGEGV